MRDKYIPWFMPKTGMREKELVAEVIDTNYLNDGDYTRLFENKIARLVGVKHCVATTSGTTAISLALMGMGVGPGDEVIVPDLTFIATANAVRLAGATVKLVDIEPRRFAIDVDEVVKNINGRTRAIVPVDVNGRAANYELLEPIAKKNGLALICDATEGLGSKCGNRYLGAFGAAGCFSFSANKTITTGQGGMIATDDTRLYHRLLELKDQGRRHQGTGGNDLHPVMGYNFKLTNIQAAIGMAQLEDLTKRIKKAKERDLWYSKALSGCPGIIVPSLENHKGEVSQWADILVEDRKGLEAILAKHNIGYRAFWHPIHRQVPYARPDTSFRNSIDVSRTGLWLPSHFNITREEVARVSEVVTDFVHRKKKNRR